NCRGTRSSERIRLNWHIDPQGALTTSVSIKLKTLLPASTQALRRTKQSSGPLKRSLRVEQHGTKLSAELVLRPKVCVTGVWLFHDTGDWTELRSEVRSEELQSTTLEVDLE